MNVYFTVDTESSMGGAWRFTERRPVSAARHVFCRRGEEELGIPLLAGLLRRYGLRGTFFVETLATRCLGDADTRSIFDFLQGAGQDVQLHLHPTFYFYAKWREAQEAAVPYSVPQPNDLFCRFDEETQMELLGEAIHYFERFAGSKPTAFRAGGYAGSVAMMRSLRHAGIKVDSSFNPCYQAGVSFTGEPLQPNRTQNIDGIWEVPVTVARSRIPEGYGGFRFADCTAVCFPEMKSMLNKCEAQGMKHFVMVFHSFSPVKAKDATYAEFRPNRIVIRRLERTLRYLAENSQRFRVETMGNLAAQVETLAVDPGAAPIPELNPLTSTLRKAVQLLNNAYWV